MKPYKEQIHSMKKFIVDNILYLALLQAIVATLGSLSLSEILHWTPCVLCWYQRICMYPLVLLLMVGILRKDPGIYKYVLPLSIIGFSISLYHNLLYYHILPESVAPCTIGVSCTTHFNLWFGFLSVPLLSFTAFTIISVCMIIYMRRSRE